jgi:hypothetical protein
MTINYPVIKSTVLSHDLDISAVGSTADWYVRVRFYDTRGKDKTNRNQALIDGTIMLFNLKQQQIPTYRQRISYRSPTLFIPLSSTTYPSRSSSIQIKQILVLRYFFVMYA